MNYFLTKAHDLDILDRVYAMSEEEARVHFTRKGWTNFNVLSEIEYQLQKEERGIDEESVNN